MIYSKFQASAFCSFNSLLPTKMRKIIICFTQEKHLKVSCSSDSSHAISYIQALFVLIERTSGACSELPADMEKVNVCPQANFQDKKMFAILSIS